MALIGVDVFGGGREPAESATIMSSTNYQRGLYEPSSMHQNVAAVSRISARREALRRRAAAINAHHRRRPSEASLYQ